MVNGIHNSPIWSKIEDYNIIQEGHFSYTLDWHTNLFVNIEQFFQFPGNVEMVAKELYELFTASDGIDFVVTPNHRGGYILAHHLAETTKSTVVIMQRKNGTIIPMGFKGHGKAIIIDDGINTGNSIKQTLRILELNNIEVVGIGVFIERYIANYEDDFHGLLKAVINLPDVYRLVPQSQCLICAEYHSKKGENGEINDQLLYTPVNIYGDY